MKKALISALVWLVALALLAVPVGAIGGPLAVAVDEMEISVHNFNFGFVVNDIFARANSGWNFTFGPGADVDTGNASIGATVGTAMNTNSTGIAVSDLEWGPFAINLGYYDGSGAGAEGLCQSSCQPGPCLHLPCWMKMALGYWFWSGSPVAIAWDKTDISVDNINIGLVFNDLFLLANTGHNFTVGLSPKVDTGHASITANVGTVLNTNVTGISLVEGGIGPVAANVDLGMMLNGLVVHGPLAVAVEEDDISVHNFNFGVVENDIFARANTGWNFTFGPGADVDTGNASVATTVSNVVNTNVTFIAKTDSGIGPIAVNADLSCGTGIGAASCLPISGGGVGPVAANIGTPGVAIAVESDDISVGNKNKAVVVNNETLLANTGHNVTMGGGGCLASADPCDPSPTPAPTTVDTGNAAVTTTVSNTVNSNSTTIVVSE